MVMFRTRPMEALACHACSRPTPWSCFQCGTPTCATCQVSMYAMCQTCRTAYHGQINVLGKQADAFIRAEFERMFV